MSNKILTDKFGRKLEVGQKIISGYNADDCLKLDVDIIESLNYTTNTVNVGGLNYICLDDYEVVITPLLDE